MSKRFGKARVPGCYCETNLTCRPCLEGAPAYHFTGNAPLDALRHHVSGAIARGEAVAIVEVR